jgi:glycosyltransferase involved in cell wall biosynthesis
MNFHNKETKPGLKFLMITTFYPPYNFGGDGIYIYRLANELAKRGHKIDIFHCIDAYELLEKNGPKGEYHNHENITVYSFRSQVGMLSPLLTQQTGYSFYKRKKIKYLISVNNYDVIHYHNMSLIGLEALTFGQSIKFYHMHEYWLVCPLHMLWKYNRNVCNKRNCITCQIVGKRPLQLWRYSNLRERQLMHIDAFLSPSLFSEKKHHEYGLNAEIHHFPYFLPTSSNREDPIHNSAFKHHRPFFLFVGRLEKIKGVQNLIRAFKKYSKCDLLIAGDGEYESTLKDLAKNVTNIKFLGRLSYQQLRSLYQNAHASIVPSIWYEVFGIIIIESFANRTPIIVNNIGALPEIAEQSKGGLIYYSDDKLIEQMEKILQNPSLRDELGYKGYQAYKKYWTEEFHINQYYRLIKEVAEKKMAINPAIKGLLTKYI